MLKHKVLRRPFKPSLSALVRLRAHTYIDDQGDAAPSGIEVMSADKRLLL